MRIRYTYTNYEDSTLATNISHTVNLILAIISPIILFGGLMLLAYPASEIYNTLATGSDFHWMSLLYFSLTYCVLILIVSIYIGTELLCLHIVQDKYACDPRFSDEKLVLVGDSKTLKLNRLISFLKYSLLYFPFLLTISISIASLIYSIMYSDWLILIPSLLVTAGIAYLAFIVTKAVKNKKSKE